MSILKQFRERWRAQDWFGVGVELGIVILGVFIGIQVSNWNGDRIAREQARNYRIEIGEELDTHAHSIEVMTAYYQQVRGHAIDALSALDAPRIGNGEQFLIDAFQATQILPRPLRLDTFEQVRADPVINLIASLPLQQQLANYEVNVASTEVTLSAITPYRDLARSRMPFGVQEKIQSACGDRTRNDATTGAATIAIPETCDPALTNGEITGAVAALRAAPDLKFMLNRQISDLDQKLRLLAGRRERVRTLAAALAHSGG